VLKIVAPSPLLPFENNLDAQRARQIVFEKLNADRAKEGMTVRILPRGCRALSQCTRTYLVDRNGS
jgi:hypothetical protein